MAAGDVITFQQFYLDLGNGAHNLGSDTLKVAIIDNSETISAALANPHFGGTGTTDLSLAEVAGTGGYTTGGITCANKTFGLSGGAAVLDFDDPAWTKAASSPTDCYYALLYNNHTAKKCICAIDLGGPVSLIAKDITWEVSASGAVRIKLPA